MKKITLLFFTLLLSGGLFAQTYSTGTINFVSGYSGKIEVTADTGVTVTMVGPSTSWLGMAFDATGMDDEGKDVIIFNGTAVSDRSFAGVGVTPPVDATQNWTVVSNNVAGSVRTVVLSRALDTGDANDHVFSASASSINITWARRLNSTAIGYHGGNSCGSTTANFVLGTEDFNINTFKMSPNPAKGFTSIELPQNVTSGTVKIYDTLGRVVKKADITSENSNIDTSALTTGSYMVILRTEYGNATKTLLVE